MKEIPDFWGRLGDQALVCSYRGFGGVGLPVTEKTYLFEDLYIETIIRYPKKVGLSGYRYRAQVSNLRWSSKPRVSCVAYLPLVQGRGC